MPDDHGGAATGANTCPPDGRGPAAAGSGRRLGTGHPHRLRSAERTEGAEVAEAAEGEACGETAGPTGLAGTSPAPTGPGWVW
ncbi:hypothetical protein SAMN05421678_1056 [Actinopolymorpha cephalotaxi]|uniref:Uncharacterized protein n=1 Tax=Actinopolymorpha cephalotaxi TaxID=504797 RepID=A0A1I2QK77_9ACTN|nr:hypothetical protein [Actinopolymorpha cephalotaxi]NYH82587.1 hypothetical protein [Actinopolymorpha cephalotaxi]SFG29005.1 hypothetical protein SAMN05421678_1056 [Actinopolymorpha cephalotaxi]